MPKTAYPFIPYTMWTASNFRPERKWIPFQSCFHSFSSCRFIINIVETIYTVTTVTICSGCKAFTVPDKIVHSVSLLRLKSKAEAETVMHKSSNNKNWLTQKFDYEFLRHAAEKRKRYEHAIIQIYYLETK